ncbi:MAG: thio(seleno)oxazole modification radical SAM maturase SbtM [Desulfobulbales bacterium]
MKEKSTLFKSTYARCSKLVPGHIWQQLAATAESVEQFEAALGEQAATLGLPGYLGELARMELHVSQIAGGTICVEQYAENLSVNPTLQLFENTWQNLAGLIAGEADTAKPEKGDELVLIWRHPASLRIMAKQASPEYMLAMKMAVEELPVPDVAREADVRAAIIESALVQALDDGVLIGPEPLLQRDYQPTNYEKIDPTFFVARTFSLQWHITQACDLHCRHCYDRSSYTNLSLEQEIAILDDLAQFCADHKIHGQVTFTGGNPLLHPNFVKLYQEAAERGFSLAILGNPTTRDQIERLPAIQPLAFYQVSLEGLEQHDDYMRGRGHFKKTLAFLELLQELKIFSMVMLTLTRDNMDQVLLLAEILRDKTDLFTFNRLSAVGEGANLAGVAVEKYPEFLRAYDEAVALIHNLAPKDNLFNILYAQQNRPLFGGCTGYGCGAAFNFITVLADGSVHACRKFPSPIGNIIHDSLRTIYHSEKAAQYRNGAVACSTCAIRPVCGGCLAVAHSNGRNVFAQKDPYCFMDGGDIS